MKKQYHIFIFLGITMLANTMRSAERVAHVMLPVVALAEVWRGEDVMQRPNVQKFLGIYDHPKQSKIKQRRAAYQKDYSLSRVKNLKQPRSR